MLKKDFSKEKPWESYEQTHQKQRLRKLFQISKNTWWTEATHILWYKPYYQHSWNKTTRRKKKYYYLLWYNTNPLMLILSSHSGSNKGFSTLVGGFTSQYAPAGQWFQVKSPPWSRCVLRCRRIWYELNWDRLIYSGTEATHVLFSRSGSDRFLVLSSSFMTA